MQLFEIASPDKERRDRNDVKGGIAPQHVLE
jgi:hypothetical protein